MPERSSYLDVPEYRQLCTWAAGAGFSQFRQHMPMIDGKQPMVTGFQCAVLIAHYHRNLLPYIEEFRKIDSLGQPWTFDYPVFGRFSPFTLRYVSILGQMLDLVGPFDNKKIVEIGGGYGGQCIAIRTVCRPQSYTIVDLPETNLLQRRFLGQLGHNDVVCTSEPPDQDWDIVISNWALTECARATQEDYVKRVLTRAQAGFMYWSHIGVGGMEDKEMAANFPGAEILAEDPLTLEGNSLIVWGHNPDAQVKKRITLQPKQPGINIMGVSKQK
jgi:hypothetical protein